MGKALKKQLKMFSNILIRQMVTQPMKEVVVIGGGLMGTGIAQVSAQSNHKITLVDLNQEILNKAEKRIQTSIGRVAKKTFKDGAKAGEEFVATSLSNIAYATNGEAALASADIIVEAISEVLPLKQKLFKQWDEMCPEKTIFATNTSFLKVGDVMKDVKRLDRCGGLHFFNPVPVMKLLEVIRIPQTSDTTFASMSAWGKAIGKYTITCKDTNGFIVNALLGPYISDAIAMVERGDATYQDVDAAVKLGLGYPMGPSKLIDQMVAEGKLGMKTGEGFYKYNKK